MRSYLFFAALYLAKAALADFGDYLYIQGFSSGTEITKLTYSLTAPSISTGYDTSDSSLWLSIWVGLSQDSADWFVQPLLNWCADNEDCGYDADESQWCVAASTLDNDAQLGQAYVAVPADATLDFEIAVDSSTNEIDQKVWLNGDLVSQQSASQGATPNEITAANKCSSSGCGTVQAYSWTNLTVTFSAAVDDLSNYFYGVSATASGFSSSNGGKTWTIEQITMAKDSTWDK